MPNFGAMVSLTRTFACMCRQQVKHAFKMNVDTELAKAKRPSQFNVSGNQIAVVVPAGWNTVLAAVRFHAFCCSPLLIKLFFASRYLSVG